MSLSYKTVKLKYYISMYVHIWHAYDMNIMDIKCLMTFNK